MRVRKLDDIEVVVWFKKLFLQFVEGNQLTPERLIVFLVVIDLLGERRVYHRKLLGCKPLKFLKVRSLHGRQEAASKNQQQNSIHFCRELC